MNGGTFFRRIIFVTFSVIFLLSAAAGATVKLYTATGEDYANEIESQDVAKLRARDKAIKNATKQAGVVLLAYSKSINSELTDDEVTAITSNAWQLVGEPKFTRTLKQISDNTTIILWTATVEVNVDDSEIQSWIKRDDKEKSQIITQTREANKASDENDKKIEDLREKYNRATSQTERDSIIKQMNDADRDFLANKKLEEGNKLRYAGDDYGAIKLYRESIKIKPNFDMAYINRGLAYSSLSLLGESTAEKAIQDFNKTIKLNPNYVNAYHYRGDIYLLVLDDYEKAIRDFSSFIKLNKNDSYVYPNNSSAYSGRALAHICLEQYEQAIKDYNKAIELAPTDATAYQIRGFCYQQLGDEAKAQADFAKAKKLGYED